MNIKFKNNGEALYIQLYNAIVSEISQGYIQNYTKLPSRRKLAEELNIAEITVNAAYKMLQDTGYAISIPRQGFFICFKTNNYSHDLPWDVRGEETYIFTANGIDKDSFPRATYAKIVKNIAYNEEFDILSHPQKKWRICSSKRYIQISVFLSEYKMLSMADNSRRGTGIPNYSVRLNL